MHYPFDTEIFKQRELPPLKEVSHFDVLIPNFYGKNKILCRFYTPPYYKENQIMLFIHGGGWCMRSVDSHHALCTHLAQNLNIKVCSIAYRLSPQSQFPSALNDIKSVYLQLKNSYKYILLSGDSSGGNLCLSLTQYEDIASKFCLLLFYPVLNDDFKTSSYKKYGYLKELNIPMMTYFWDSYVSYEKRNSPFICPGKVFNSKKIQKILIFSAEKDGLLSENTDFIKKLSSNGIPSKHIILKEAHHGFMTYGSGHEKFARETLLLINEKRDLLIP